MALLVGIDEAGYGPHLGPLVVAGAAVEFNGASVPAPDLWGAMGEWVVRRTAGAADRVVICDSKKAFVSSDRARGIVTLERAVLGFLTAASVRPRTLAEFLEQTRAGPASPAAEEAAPWDRPERLALPLQAAPQAVESAADLLARGFAAVGGRAAHLWVSAVPAAYLNRLMDGAGRNKAQALFMVAAEVLSAARGFRPRDPVFVTMDQHGGRKYYADLLAGAFPMHQVRTVEESADGSRYVLDGGAGGSGAPMHLTVCEKCEAWSLVTALASMAAKYVRELCMDEFNEYFAERVPGLKPTAGYGRDATRFLAETAAARAAAEMPLEVVLRLR